MLFLYWTVPFKININAWQYGSGNCYLHHNIQTLFVWILCNDFCKTEFNTLIQKNTICLDINHDLCKTEFNIKTNYVDICHDFCKNAFKIW